jgi:hypothetical protein
LSWSPRTFFVFSAQMSCSKGVYHLMKPTYHRNFFFLAEFPFRKRCFITARHSFTVKSPLLCAVFTSDR